MLNCQEWSFLGKDDAQIFHGDNFGGQLAFHKVLFVNGCYGLYILKYLKIFSLGNLTLSFMEWYFLFVSFMKDLSCFSVSVYITKISLMNRR